MFKFLALASVAGLLAALPLSAARAQTYDTSSNNYPWAYTTPNGAYVGGAWGRFDYRIDSLSDVEQGVSDITHSSDNAWKIDVGYRFSPYWAIEADYVDLGNPNDGFQATGSSGNYRAHLTGFAPFLVGTLPAGPIELFAKAGWLWYDSNLQVNLNQPGSQVIETSHHFSNFIYGGGIGVTLFRHLNVNLEYDGIRIENAPTSTVLWLGANYRF